MVDVCAGCDAAATRILHVLYFPIMSNDFFSSALRLLTAIVLATSPTFAQVPEGLSSSDWSSIRGAYEDGRHRVFERADGTHEARTHAQQYATTFDGRRAIVASDGGDWSFGLELVRYGFDRHAVEVVEPRRSHVEGQRIAYVWDDVVTEWYVNRTAGLEHGFTVSARPEGADEGSELRFDLRVLGNLAPSVDANGLGVALVADGGERVASYAGLVVTDAHGHALAARMTTTADVLSILVDASDAAYPITIDPLVQQAYVKASNPDPEDYFGWSVATDGDTFVVGAPGEASGSTGVDGSQADNDKPFSGAAYVFTRSGTTWVQQAYLKAANSVSFGHFGQAVDIDGDTIVVTADWRDGNAGAAYVFTRTGTVWSQQAYIKASNPDTGDNFGISAAIDGDTVVVGANSEDSGSTGVDGNQADNFSSSAGAAYIFVRSGSTWSQQAYLKASNTDSGDRFGGDVAIDGDTVVVGASGERSNATGVNGDESNDAWHTAGAAYVFERSGSSWSQKAYLKASNTSPFDQFGLHVAVHEDTVVVAVPNEDSAATGVGGDETSNAAPESGAVYVFVPSGSTWVQSAYIKASNTGTGDGFGSSVACSDGTIVVGAPFESSAAIGVNGDQSNDAMDEAGAAYVFIGGGSAWVQAAYLKASNSGAHDQFGLSVDVDERVVVGAPFENSNSNGVDGDQQNDAASESGAVYVFESVPEWLVVNGCHGNAATYVVPSAPARIDSMVPIDLLGSVVTEGAVATFFGSTSVDSMGCGVLLAPSVELLINLSPLQTYAVTDMTGGVATLVLDLPDNPGLVGIQLTLQSAVIDLSTFAVEVSNALEFVIVL
jgi:hypothetical protein